MRGWRDFDPDGHWWQHSFVLYVVRRWTFDLVVDLIRGIGRLLSIKGGCGDPECPDCLEEWGPTT